VRGLALALLLLMPTAGAAPLIIAHRGASAYLPEHSLAAKAVAHAMGADFLEQDVVLSADGVPIVLHDIYLEPTTDVELRFPDRSRDDGRFYAIDFSLQEIRRLRLHERSERGPDGTERAVFPTRYPLGSTPFTVPTLAEELALVEGLNRSRGARAGVYIELKAPAWHAEQGHDIALAVLRVLEQSGWSERPGQVFLQCFDPATLRRMRRDLGVELPLIQLVADNSWGESAADYDAMLTDAGLDEVAGYADGIGPWLMQLYRGTDAAGSPQVTDLATRAHQRGLAIHPYTFRADQLPTGIGSYEQLLELFLVRLGVDGLFTDFPDLTRDFLLRRR
jgi:glycerophosphoryl diester phosphodiesterase